MPYGSLNTIDPKHLEHYILGGMLNPFVQASTQELTGHSYFTGRDFAKRVKAPAAIVAAQRLGVPIPGFGAKEDIYTKKQVPGYSPKLDMLLRLFPQFGQSAGIVPGGGTESSRLSRVRYFGGLSLSPYDRARQSYYAQKFGK